MIDAEHIQLSIDAEDVIEFAYPSSIDTQLVVRRLSPWRLESDDRIVFGYDHGREAPRRYALAKMAAVDVALSESFVQPT